MRTMMRTADHATDEVEIPDVPTDFDTERQRLEARLRELEVRRAALAEQAHADEAADVAALAAGESRPVRDGPDPRAELALLDGAAVAVRRRLGDPDVALAHAEAGYLVLEDVRQQLDGAEAVLDGALEVYEARIADARRALQAARDGQATVRTRLAEQRRRLNAQLAALDALARPVLAGREAAERQRTQSEIDERRREELLAGLRRGETTTVVAGTDATAAAAVSQYQEERRQLRSWAAEATARMRTSGEAAALPPFATLYPEARLRRLCDVPEGTPRIWRSAGERDAAIGQGLAKLGPRPARAASAGGVFVETRPPGGL
jgi:hypothetical protein